jgi:hypothetical protein
MKLAISRTDAQERKFVSLLVSGDPKIGKTTLVKTLPVVDDSKVLILDADRGSLSLSDRKFQVVRGPFDDDLRKEVLAHIEAEAKANKLDWVVVDGLDEIGKTILENEQIAEAREAKPNQYAAYDRLGNKARSFIRRLQGLPVNSLFITHQYVDSENPIKFWPDFPGIKLYREIPALFDTVLAMYLKQELVAGKPENKRVLQTMRDQGSSPLYQTGIRDPHGLVKAYEEPDLGKLLKKMLDGVGEKK